jgi:hypothetical protein
VFNTSTIFGTDGSLTLSDATELDADTFGEYFGESGAVARVVNVALQVTTRIHPFYEMGSRLPTELRTGNISIGGSVERAYVNGGLLRMMLGQYAVAEEAAGLRVPTFNMKLILDNLRPPGDDGNSLLTVYGVTFDSWQWNLPESDFALERLSFRARRLAVTDSSVPAGAP